MFQIRRDRCDPIFVQSQTMANRNKRKTLQRGDAQPSSDQTSLITAQNTIEPILLWVSGTRATNIQPIRIY